MNSINNYGLNDKELENIFNGKSENEELEFSSESGSECEYDRDDRNNYQMSETEDDNNSEDEEVLRHPMPSCSSNLTQKG